MKLSDIFSRGLNFKLIMFFLLVALIPLIIIGLLVDIQAENALEEQQQTALINVGEIVEEALQKNIDGQRDVIEAIASHHWIHSYIEDYGGDANAISQVQRALQHYFDSGAGDQFYELFLLDDEGMVVTSTNEGSIGEDKSKDDYYLGAVEKSATHVKDVYLSSSTGEKGYAVSTIVQDHSGKYVGVVAGRVSMEVINDLLSHSMGSGGETLDVFIVNGDKKVVSIPRFGHLEGDYALRKLGNYLQTNLREDDISAKYGGDEFGIIMPNTTFINAKDVFGRVVAWDFGRIKFTPKEGSVESITFSAGISTLYEDIEEEVFPDIDFSRLEPEDVLRVRKAMISGADYGLYQVKQSGRNNHFPKNGLPYHNRPVI